MYRKNLLNSLKKFNIRIVKSHGEIHMEELIKKMDEIYKICDMKMRNGAVRAKTSKNPFEDLDFIDQIGNNG